MRTICQLYTIHPNPGQCQEKINLVCYHTVYESATMGKSLVGHIPRKENVTDLMTKVLYGQKRKSLVSNILYDVHDDH